MIKSQKATLGNERNALLNNSRCRDITMEIMKYL